MLKFIKLGDQINGEGINEFAFFETTGDSFVRLNETQVWEDWSSFEEDYKSDWIYGYEQEYIAECKRLYDAEIAQGRASNSNSRDLGSKPVSAPQNKKGVVMKRTSEVYKNFIMTLEANAHTENAINVIDLFYDKAYKEGFEAGKERQKEAMQEGKVTYARIT